MEPNLTPPPQPPISSEQPNPMLPNKPWGKKVIGLAIVIIIFIGFAVHWIVTPTAQYLEEKTSPVEVGVIDEEIYQMLKDGNYKMENVSPSPCGENVSACDEIEPLLGWYAVENKPNGFRINLSPILFRPYAFDYYDPGVESVEKVGSSIFLISSKDNATYEFRIPEKKILRFNQNI